MMSLQKLLGKEDKFLGLLEASAQEACQSVQALIAFFSQPAEARSLEPFAACRRREKEINNQIADALCTDFVSALDRDDVQALAYALYKIPKTVEKIAERYLLAPDLARGVDLSAQTALLEKAAGIVLTMLKDLRGGAGLSRIKAHNEALQAAEGEADKLMTELLRRLYTEPFQPVQVVFLKDLFEILEEVADRCRDAGNILAHIALKGA